MTDTQPVVTQEDLIRGFFLPKTIATPDQPTLAVANVRTNFGVTHVDVTENHYPHGKSVGAYGPCSYSVSRNGNLKGTKLHLEPAPQQAAHRTASTAAIQKQLDMAVEALENIGRDGYGLQSLIEAGEDTTENVSDYFYGEMSRRKQEARDTLAAIKDQGA